MLRFQRGDEAAFEELVRRNTPKVYALIYRFLGDCPQVEDLTQEVFLRIYRTGRRYKPTAKFSTWLYRIVANLAFNVTRSRKKVKSLQIIGDEEEEGESYFASVADDGVDHPAKGMDNAELSEVISVALERLPENQKIAIILNKYEDKSYEEIAEILDSSVMAVKSLLSRARLNLRDVLLRYLRP